MSKFSKMATKDQKIVVTKVNQVSKTKLSINNKVSKSRKKGFAARLEEKRRHASFKKRHEKQLELMRREKEMKLPFWRRFELKMLRLAGSENDKLKGLNGLAERCYNIRSDRCRNRSIKYAKIVIDAGPEYGASSRRMSFSSDEEGYETQFEEEVVEDKGSKRWYKPSPKAKVAVLTPSWISAPANLAHKAWRSGSTEPVQGSGWKCWIIIYLCALMLRLLISPVVPLTAPVKLESQRISVTTNLHVENEVNITVMKEHVENYGTTTSEEAFTGSEPCFMEESNEADKEFGSENVIPAAQFKAVETVKDTELEELLGKSTGDLQAELAGSDKPTAELVKPKSRTFNRIPRVEDLQTELAGSDKPIAELLKPKTRTFCRIPRAELSGSYDSIVEPAKPNMRTFNVYSRIPRAELAKPTTAENAQNIETSSPTRKFTPLRFHRETKPQHTTPCVDIKNFDDFVTDWASFF